MSRPPRSRSSLVVPAVLCALVALGGTPTLSQGADGPEASAEVARLYKEASDATQHYEEGRKAAALQKKEAQKAERLLAQERRESAVLHDDLGRFARAQYRSGGDVPVAAQMLLSDHPEELMRGQRAARQADLALDHAIGRSRRAEKKLEEGRRKATAAWASLEKRNAELAGLKKTIASKLQAAQASLQGEADQSVAAGQCRGAVRLDQPPITTTRAWVTPVETYELSAGFDSAGARWAHRHTGQDFAVGIGTPVRAAGDGRVVSVSCGGAFGIQIVVRHRGGYYTQYAHLSALAVDQGEQVRAGQWIGLSGTTGNSTGPHLHFEVRLTPYLGSGVDPVGWFAERGIPL
ncbi:peptidoglycan DD-metalloendopeptidase family protein [Streptomyces sp. SID5785]|uniref:M23 family metallopeptidase n=1 Tax=Streptomyces sp. SID5785 TaxID=2690309 RepID=UPI0013614850|nr:M23 family metallopeptidase [Streptomyces sp. SID5785]MZD04282.1 peptidoglycan DD-metalloendopeptidase family protein [Streptomyces sp. SID5785]